jgi:hypothetical protein
MTKTTEELLVSYEASRIKRRQVEPDNFDWRCRAFAWAMRRLAQLEAGRSKFIAEAFQRGRSDEWRLDNEAVRPIVLPLLHEFFDRPQHISSDLHHQYERAICTNRHRHGAASLTLEAVMYSLRKRRTGALKEPDTRHRLAQLNEDQLVEVASRLQKLKPNIAQPWSDQEIAELVIARNQC